MSEPRTPPKDGKPDTEPKAPDTFPEDAEGPADATPLAGVDPATVEPPSAIGAAPATAPVSAPIPLERSAPGTPRLARDRSLVLAVLGAALASIGLCLIIFRGGDGVWNPSRLLVTTAPILGGAFLVAIGLLQLRRFTASLPPAQTIPPQTVASRLGAAVEPYEVWLVFAAALLVLLPGIWSYTLIDPWEGHYAEVARRILEDDDWVHLRWQHKIFRSKPVLTFWLIAGSMNSFGIGQGGGYSGELVASGWVVFAVRLPFALFGAMGIASIFWMLSNLVSRRLAWMAAGVIATSTFYFMVARQSITDMPMVACVMGAIACLLMTIERGDEPIEAISPTNPIPLLRRVTSLHVFAAVFVLAIGGQAFYYGVYFTHSPLARAVKMPAPALIISGWMLIWLAGLIATMFLVFPVKRRGQVWMFWFYALVGVALLAKGPPGLGLVGLVALSFLVVTGRWRLLRRFEIPRGAFITSLVAVPWHMAMWMRDGPAWVNEYFNHHMFGRFTKGVHGDRGTFEYFAEQIGIGFWPWAALIPAALATVLVSASLKNRETRVRLVIGIWAVAGFAMFSISQTKFHHYILPVVPAFGILVAIFVDDIWRGRVSRLVPAALTGVAIVGLICRDLLGEQEKLIELYIYRHDRPWPSGEPWNLDITEPIFIFGLVFAAIIAALALPPVRAVSRKIVIAVLFAAALAWSYWAGTFYMQAAAPHWGQRALHRTYYAQRHIHGIDVKYYGLRELADDWKGRSEMSIRSVLPDDFAVGQPATINLEIPNVGLPNNTLSLAGQVSAAGADEFTVKVSDAELSRLAPYIEQGRSSRRARPRWRQVNADRMITWQLNWRGENFWSAGEIYGESNDTRTVFTKTDNKAFNEYIKKPDKIGRTFYIITEAGRAKGLKGLLPTQRGKDTFEILDTSCNKFTLLRFSL